MSISAYHQSLHREAPLQKVYVKKDEYQSVWWISI